MAFIQLSSTNPDFSHILKKNPASGMMIKGLRLGQAFGWYTGEQTYNVFFKDAENEVSYKDNPDQEFEYLDTSRYSSSLFPVNVTSDFFNHIINKPEEKDTLGFEHTYFLNMVNAKAKYFDIFKRHFPDFNMNVSEICPEHFKVVISTKKTLRELLCFVNLLMLFNALKTQNYSISGEGEMDKYLNNLQILDAPYFVKYVFKVNLLRYPDKFNKYKPVLEKSNIEKLSLTFGNSGIARLQYIKNALGKALNFPIVDLGCGEGNYVIDLARKMPPEQIYYAIDTNEECRETVKNKVAKKQLQNVQILESLDQFLENPPEEKYNVLLSEVIEHMTVEEATALAKRVITLPNVGQVFITTPNKDFNKNYVFDSDEEMRHDDHKFEFTPKEFEDWVEKVLDGVEGKVPHFHSIGDTVNGSCTTLGVFI